VSSIEPAGKASGGCAMGIIVGDSSPGHINVACEFNVITRWRVHPWRGPGNYARLQALT
jgi:hypothetical protein